MRNSTNSVPVVDAEGVDLSIGCNGQPFIGVIDEVKIHRRAPSPQEIRARYDQEKPRRARVDSEIVE